ncbi:carbohydrate-binding protein [Gorillibacterium massiliense]|uniref:carbohydrate-binding protein n=1 Tax=Gorillibacterium massiliense TaxID=1280390 RepID=UPI0004BAF597|nr:carbohydrate-binding protein [Gorillibacterium massiliense]
MNTLTLEIQNADGAVLSANTDEDQVYLVHKNEYEPGDSIVLKSSADHVHLVIQLEDAMNPAQVYLLEKEYRFVIPFGDKRVSYSPKSFIGSRHVLTARLATEEEVAAYRNLAKNEYDHHQNTTLFPHASANVETRGEAVFAARNAINGNAANDSHGEWPYESWGINQRADAAITVNFGRIVEIDRVVLTLRADFPHDNYWEKVTLSFSDGSKITADLVKTHKPQTVALASRKVEWVTLSELIKSDDPSPFPALSQIEVYGWEIN